MRRRRGRERGGLGERGHRQVGVEAQNAAELANILGVDFDISEYSYDTLPRALVTGQADIVGAELFVTDDRKKLIDFSTPYYQSGQLFYVLEDSPYQTIDDLNKPNVRFIYGTGTAQLELAQKYVPRAMVSDRQLATGFCSTTSSPPTEPTPRCLKRRR